MKEVDLVLVLLELTFQLRRSTNACAIKREIYLVIDISCENAEGIQKDGRL